MKAPLASDLNPILRSLQFKPTALPGVHCRTSLSDDDRLVVLKITDNGMPGQVLRVDLKTVKNNATTYVATFYGGMPIPRLNSFLQETLNDL